MKVGFKFQRSGSRAVRSQIGRFYRVGVPGVELGLLGVPFGLGEFGVARFVLVFVLEFGLGAVVVFVLPVFRLPPNSFWMLCASSR